MPVQAGYLMIQGSALYQAGEGHTRIINGEIELKSIVIIRLPV
jgi:hypothetical protein